MAGLVAGALSLGLARLGLAWQRRHWGEGLWMIPVNLPMFYFVPLFSVAAFTITTVAGRRDTWVSLALASAALYSIGRVVFWQQVAAALGGHPTPEQFDSAWADRALSSSVVSALGLFTYMALGLGLRTCFRAPRSPA